MLANDGLSDQPKDDKDRVVKFKEEPEHNKETRGRSRYRFSFIHYNWNECMRVFYEYEKKN